jgi:hypothetical protein
MPIKKRAQRPSALKPKDLRSNERVSKSFLNRPDGSYDPAINLIEDLG